MGKKTKKLLFICTIILFLITPFLNMKNIKTMAFVDDNIGLLTSKGTAQYYDYFTNTQYYNEIASNIDGWGDGTLTAERNVTRTKLDEYQLNGPVFDLQVQGRKAFAVTYNQTTNANTMHAFDITNPADITLINSRDSYAGMQAIAVDGDALYAGAYHSGDYRIATYNITDLTTFDDPMGAFLTYRIVDGPITDIEPFGHLVYLTAYNSYAGKSLYVLYAEDIANPVLTQCNWLNNKALAVEVQGQVAYVAAGTDGLYILNVSNRYTPTEIAHIDTPGNASDVLVEGHFAYVADGEAGVHVVNLNNLASPTIVGSYNSNGNVRKLALQGKTLIAAQIDGGDLILDVSLPSNPVKVLEEASSAIYYSVDLYGGDMIFGTANGIETVRACAGDGITDFSKVNINTFDDYEAWDVRVRGDIAYVVGGYDGFYTLNISDPRNPQLLDLYTHPSLTLDFKRLDVDGNFAHLITSDVYFIMDISNPESIELIYLSAGGGLNDVHVRGTLAYISYGELGGGFGIVNFTNPYSPDTFGTEVVGNNITAIWAQGPHLYLADNRDGSNGEGFYVYDISDFNNAKQTDSRIFLSGMNDVHVSGDIACLGNTNWGYVYNVSDPFSVVKEYSLYTDHYIDTLGVWQFGPYVSSVGPEGAFLWNLVDLGAPTYSHYANAVGGLQVTMRGDYTYIANKSNLLILRHYESAGTTFDDEVFIGLSTEVDNTDYQITNATLTVNEYFPDGYSRSYYMSADGGDNWDYVLPNTFHTFANPGNELLWRIIFDGPTDRSPQISSISIRYRFNNPPSTPQFSTVSAQTTPGNYTVFWLNSSDNGFITNYELQMSDNDLFATINKTWILLDDSLEVANLTLGTYYFRIRAIDNYGETSTWSSLLTLTVASASPGLSPLVLGLIIGGSSLGVIAIITIVIIVIRKK